MTIALNNLNQQPDTSIYTYSRLIYFYKIVLAFSRYLFNIAQHFTYNNQIRKKFHKLEHTDINSSKHFSDKQDSCHRNVIDKK